MYSDTPELSDLPDLASPEAFQSWYIEQQARFSVQVILKRLGADDSDLARLRYAMICYYATNLEDEFKYYVRLCLDSNDKIITGYAKALLSFKYYQVAFSQGEKHELESTIELIPLMERVLDEFAAMKPSPFLREAESAVRATLASFYLNKGRLREAEQEAAEALFLAKELKAPLSAMRARQRIMNIHYTAGKIHHTLVALLGRTDEEKLVHNTFSMYADITLAAAYSQLGDRDKALSILRSLRQVHATPRIDALLLLYESISATGGLEGAAESSDYGAKPNMWLVEALRHMIISDGQPRLNAHNGKRKEHLEQVLEVTDKVYVNDDWFAIMRSWLRATALMKLGRPEEAWRQIANVPTPGQEEYDLRLLLTGVQLELSLKLPLAHLLLKTQHYEEALRKIFSDAEAIPFASPQGIAKLLLRWHPVAAAYGAVMPIGIPQLQKAAEAMLHVGPTCHLYGITIPPMFACELLLRSLDFDLPFERSFIQARLNKRDRAKRETILLTRYGSVPYWQPVISVVQLLYGLAQAQENKIAYQDAALSLIRRYGLVPHTDAIYEYAPLLPKIEEATNGLLANRYTTKGFAQTVIDLF